MLDSTGHTAVRNDAQFLQGLLTDPLIYCLEVELAKGTRTTPLVEAEFTGELLRLVRLTVIRVSLSRWLLFAYSAHKNRVSDKIRENIGG